MANEICNEARRTIDVTIANGQSLSPEVDLKIYTLVAIIPPAGIAGSYLTFQGGIVSGAVGNLKNSAGEISYPLAASNPVAIDPADMMGWQYLKIRTGTAATPSAQSADKTLTLVVKLI